jgi:hypothetical protein
MNFAYCPHTEELLPGHIVELEASFVAVGVERMVYIENEHRSFLNRCDASSLFCFVSLSQKPSLISTCRYHLLHLLLLSNDEVYLWR